MKKENKYDMKIIDILEEMESMLHEANAFLLSKKVSVDRDEFLDLIEELKRDLPDELETAVKVMEEQESIVSSARTDAEFILEEARQEREKMLKKCNEDIENKNKQVDSEIENMMREATIRAEELVSQNRITRDAKDRAEKMIREAKEYSRNIRDGARGYSIEQLTMVEGVLSNLLEEVKTNKTQL